MNYTDVVVAMYGIRKEASLNKQAWIPGQHLANAFVNNAQNGAKAIGGGLKSLGQGVANKAKTMANKVTDQAQGLYNGVRGATNWAANQIQQGYGAAMNQELADARNAYQAGKNQMQAYGQQLADNARYTAQGLGMYGQEALNAAKAKGQQMLADARYTAQGVGMTGQEYGNAIANEAKDEYNRVRNFGNAAAGLANVGYQSAKDIGRGATNWAANQIQQGNGGRAWANWKQQYLK